MLYSKTVAGTERCASRALAGNFIFSLGLTGTTDLIICVESSDVSCCFAASAAEINLSAPDTFFPLKGYRDYRFKVGTDCNFVGVLSSSPGYFTWAVVG
jgi:hypothetical protein